MRVAVACQPSRIGSAGGAIAAEGRPEVLTSAWDRLAEVMASAWARRAITAIGSSLSWRQVTRITRYPPPSESGRAGGRCSNAATVAVELEAVDLDDEALVGPEEVDRETRGAWR